MTDTALNNGFGTLVAGEERHIQRAVPQRSIAVEDGIQFGMADEGVFRIEECPLPFPWHFVIAAPGRHTVVSHGNDPVVCIDNTRTDLCVIVLAPLCGKQGNTHEVGIPADVFCSFHEFLHIAVQPAQ